MSLPQHLFRKKIKSKSFASFSSGENQRMAFFSFVVLTLQLRFDLDTFVETGTYFGVTLGGLIGDFERLVSVEISKSLYESNSKRYQGQKHVTLLHGDSR